MSSSLGKERKGTGKMLNVGYNFNTNPGRNINFVKYFSRLVERRLDLNIYEIYKIMC